MLRYLLALALAVAPALAHAGTLTITASGFSTLSASPPANWPSSFVTFPASGNPNGTKTYTVNDADWLALLQWMAFQQQGQISTVVSSTVLPLTPTAAQILLAWLQIWVNGTKSSIQQFQTTPAVVPPPINMQ